MSQIEIRSVESTSKRSNKGSLFVLIYFDLSIVHHNRDFFSVFLFY